MSKVISFSISDRYLDKLRSLYPSLTDNLAAKQFLTDRLDSSLGSGLDASLDDGLDDRVTTLIESWVDGLLDERLDATVGKLLTSLSERMARLEARLDDSLDGSLDDMERLLRLQQSASIATSPIVEPTGETSHDEPDQPAIGTVTPEVSPSPPNQPAIEDSEKKIIPLPDTLIVSPIETVESGSESISSINEPDTDAIETVPGETDSIEPVTGEGMNPNKARDYLISKGIEDISYYYLNKWAKDGVIDTSPQGKNAIKHLILRGKLYFPKTDQP